MVVIENQKEERSILLSPAVEVGVVDDQATFHPGPGNLDDGYSRPTLQEHLGGYPIFLERLGAHTCL